MYRVFLTRGVSGNYFPLGLGQLPLGLENFLQKYPIFLPPGQTKISWNRVKKYLGQSRAGPLFIAGQKYAQAKAHL